MLIVAGHIIAAPGARQAFIDAARPMVAATLDEPGCREYCFSPDPNDENRIMLHELWDDQAALDAHFATDHMAVFTEAMGALDLAGADIKKYTISEVGPVR